MHARVPVVVVGARDLGASLSKLTRRALALVCLVPVQAVKFARLAVISLDFQALAKSTRTRAEFEGGKVGTWDLPDTGSQPRTIHGFSGSL